MLVSAPEFKTSDYRAMVDEVRGDCPELREVVFLGDQQWEQLLATRPRRRPRAAGRARA